MYVFIICFRVNSPIDDFPMDGVMSLRVKSFNDLTHDTYTIRWTEVLYRSAVYLSILYAILTKIFKKLYISTQHEWSKLLSCWSFIYTKFCDIHEISRLCVFMTAVQYYLQVFFVQVDETRLTIDAMEITQFSETIANSSCVALAPYLQKLHDQDMKKVALRVTLGPEQVRHMFLPLLSSLTGRWCDLWPLGQLSCDCIHV